MFEIIRQIDYRQAHDGKEPLHNKAAHIHKTVAEQADRNGPFTLVPGTVIEGLNGWSEALTVGLEV